VLGAADDSADHRARQPYRHRSAGWATDDHFTAPGGRADVD
jgi:hypothetical protein